MNRSDIGELVPGNRRPGRTDKYTEAPCAFAPGEPRLVRFIIPQEDWPAAAERSPVHQSPDALTLVMTRRAKFDHHLAPLDT
jgi:hypothetical protein